MIESFEPSWLSLLPALVTIGLAFLMRQVVPALFLGIVTGSVVLYASTSNLDDLNREKHDLGNQKGIDYGGRTAATDELNAKAAAAQGGGDNKALAMFGGGKKKSPFG